MDHAFLVRGLERFTNVLRNAEGFIDWNRAALKPAGERIPFDELQNEKA